MRLNIYFSSSGVMNDIVDVIQSLGVEIDTLGRALIVRGAALFLVDLSCRREDEAQKRELSRKT
jgi:hypothetical protein